MSTQDVEVAIAFNSASHDGATCPKFRAVSVRVQRCMIMTRLTRLEYAMRNRIENQHGELPSEQL